MASGGGGAWKVAYANFVTAMMAFFMVMWLTTQKEGVKEAVAGYFREPFATYRSNEKGAAATAKPVQDPMYGHTAQPQKRLLPKAGKDQDYQFTVLFPIGGAELEPSELESIQAFAPTMTGKLNRIEVRAHSLRHPLPDDSDFQDHWQLCYRRCRAVQQALEAQGIESERIRLSQAEGNEPLSLDLSQEELKLNSRVDVMLLSDLAQLPWERQQGKKPPAESSSVAGEYASGQHDDGHDAPHDGEHSHEPAEGVPHEQTPSDHAAASPEGDHPVEAADQDSENQHSAAALEHEPSVGADSKDHHALDPAVPSH